MTYLNMLKKWIAIFLTVALALQGPVFVFAENISVCETAINDVSCDAAETAEGCDIAANDIASNLNGDVLQKSLSENALPAEALAEFESMQGQQAIFGYIFDGDTYDAYMEPSTESEKAMTFRCGDIVHIKAPYLNLAEKTLFYQVQELASDGNLTLDGNLTSNLTSNENQSKPQAVYVERAHLATSDSRFLEWEEKWIQKKIDDIVSDCVAAEVNEESDKKSDEIAAVIHELSQEDYTATVNGIEDFPATYQTKLASLAKKHPNWVFVKYNTGIKWSDAVTAEKGDRSWIYETAPSDYKSSHVSGKWYYATKKAIEYYMDPRNSLTEDYILMHEKLSYDGAYQTQDGVQSLVDNTFMEGKISSANQGGQDSDKDLSYETYAQALFAYGKSEGVSPYHLASRIIQEQGSGGDTTMISGTYSQYPGYFNFFNIKASGTGDDAVKTGLAYAKDKKWNTRRKALKGGADFISSGYIDRGQNTKYLEKWDLISPYTHQYMQNIQAPYTETKKVKDAYAKQGLMNRDFVFRIPVFLGMPGNAADDIETKPLESISIEPSSLTMCTGQQERLLFTYSPVATSDDPTPTWTSSEPENVKVDEDGLVTALKAGGSTITAKVGDFTATCKVTVALCKVRYHKSSNPSEIYSTATAAVGETLADNPCKESYRTVNSVFPEGEDRDGYSFSGYYTQQNGGGKLLTADTIITDDIDIYPYYRPLTANFTVKEPGSFVYTGKKIKPELYVYDGSKRLVEGVDYKVKYENNKNRTEESNPARIIVKGKGNYQGTKTVTFQILPKDLSSRDISAADVSATFTGKDYVYGKPKVTESGKKLKLGKDYTLTYPLQGQEGAYLLQGNYPIQINGIGNYSGTILAYEVLSIKTLMSSCKVKVEKAEYTGEVIVPHLTVTNSKKTVLKEGEDYFLICPSDMVSAGEKKLRLRGNPEHGYSGSCTVTLKVEGVAAKTLTVSNVENVMYDPTSALNGYRQESLEIRDEQGHLLTKNEYSVSYGANTAVGTAKLMITGKGKYVGTKTVKFKILPRELSEKEMESGGLVFAWNGGTDQIPYTKKATTPSFILTYKGVKLRENVDYKVSYKNNKNLSGESAAMPIVTIKGKKNYSGTVEKTFSVIERDFQTLNNALIVTTASYSENSGKWKPAVSIVDTNGNLLTEGKDYTHPEYTYVTDVTVQGKDGSVQRKAGDVVDKKDIVPAGTRIKMSVTGCSPYSPSTLTREFIVQKKLISKLSQNKLSKAYTGSDVTLAPGELKLSDGWNNLTEGVDFEIVNSTYKNNIEKGTASVYVRGIGNYSGVKVIKFKITPRILF